MTIKLKSLSEKKLVSSFFTKYLFFSNSVFLPGASKTSFFFDRILRNVMSLVGSRSLMADLAWKKKYNFSWKQKKR